MHAAGDNRFKLLLSLDPLGEDGDVMLLGGCNDTPQGGLALFILIYAGDQRNIKFDQRRGNVMQRRLVVKADTINVNGQQAAPPLENFLHHVDAVLIITPAGHIYY